jgi:predicted amidohydrolase YtcJ
MGIDCIGLMSDTVYLDNARIWTGIPGAPRAGAVRAEGGRITGVDGSMEAGDRRLDGGGGTVVPGLVDAHVHLVLGGQSLRQLDLSTARSRADFERLVAGRHAELDPDTWLIAHGWSETRWPGSELPDKTWLAAAGARPVVCYRCDLHASLVNDAVLDRLDLRRDPDGGRVVRDAAGAPTGLLLESAVWELVNPLVPALGARERQDALRTAQAHAHARGLTAVGTMEYLRTVDEVFVPVRDELTLRCRVTLLDRDWPLDTEPGRRFDGDDHLAVIGYKAFLDGTFGSRTARMLEDYADDPGNRGLLLELAADGHLQAWAQRVAAAGLSPSMHAIGDEAVALALAAAALVPAARPRVEHVQHIAEADIARAKGVVASMQPLHKAADGPVVPGRLGPERARRAFAFRALADAGAVLAFGSDWPVVSCDPLLGIRAAVTGLTVEGVPCAVEQNLTVAEALTAYTSGAAFALGLDEAGTIRVGAPADLVLLDRDPFEADWADDPPAVRMTIAGGRVVYDAR